MTDIKIKLQNLYPNIKLDPVKLGTVSTWARLDEKLPGGSGYTLGQVFKMSQKELEEINRQMTHVVNDLRL